MRGLGRSATSMVTSITGAVALRVLWILFIFPLNPQLYMLYLSFPIAWVLTAGAHYTLAALALRSEIRKNREAELASSAVATEAR